MRDKHKKDKDKYREKSGKDKSPHGDVVLRTSLSWDSSHGELLAAAAAAELCTERLVIQRGGGAQRGVVRICV